MKKKQFIKKAVYIFLTVFFLLPLYSQDSVVVAQAEHEVPLLLEGVWKNYSRYVVFDTGFSGFDGQPELQEVLRIFYAWYDDRAAESSSYTQDNPRDVNDATPRASAEEITVNFHPLTEQLFTREYNLDVVDENGTVFYAVDEPSGAWD
ncbi:MAG: hypothetical protein J6Z17_04395, partial [Treponema sp.]|nr:hypothetical protein [Treponema sp.]